jgi:hypothetical protein
MDGASESLQSEIDDAAKKLTDLIGERVKFREEGQGYIELTEQIAFITGMILSIIKLKNGSAFICENEQDVALILQNIDGVGDSFRTLRESDFENGIYNPLQTEDTETPDGSLDDPNLAYVPEGFQLKAYDDQIIAEKDIPGYGALTIPVNFVKKCDAEASFGDDAKVQQWLSKINNIQT